MLDASVKRLLIPGCQFILKAQCIKEYLWEELVDWWIQRRETWLGLFIAMCRSLSEVKRNPQTPPNVRTWGLSLSMAARVLQTKERGPGSYN